MDKAIKETENKEGDHVLFFVKDSIQQAVDAAKKRKDFEDVEKQRKEYETIKQQPSPFTKKSKQFRIDGKYQLVGIQYGRSAYFTFLFTPNDENEQKYRCIWTYKAIAIDYCKGKYTNHPFCVLHDMYQYKPSQPGYGDATKRFFQYLYVDEKKWEARENDNQTIFHYCGIPLSGAFNDSLLPKNGKITGIRYSLPSIQIEYMNQWRNISEFGQEHIPLLKTISNMIPTTTIGVKKPQLLYPNKKSFGIKNNISLSLVLALPPFFYLPRQQDEDESEEQKSLKEEIGSLRDKNQILEKQIEEEKRKFKEIEEEFKLVKEENKGYESAILLFEKERRADESTILLFKEERVSEKRKFKELVQFTTESVEILNKKSKITK
jgi:hypothetical protein